MRVDFYFDFSCPFAYLGWTQIRSLCARRGVSLELKPMLLGGIFRALGTLPVPDAKRRHSYVDMDRWAKRWNVPLVMPAAHPMKTVRALRAVLALPRHLWTDAIDAFYRAYWVDGLDLNEHESVAGALRKQGLDDELIAAAVAANDDPAIKAELRRRTDEAVARGVFGAPTVFVCGADGNRDLMFWGQDRLSWVEEALSGAAARSDAPVDCPVSPPTTLEFWFDFASPFAYLASTQIENIAARTGATVHWKPMLLGGVFRTVGQAMVPIEAMAESRRRYHHLELERWAQRWQVPYLWPTRFPHRTVTALRLATLAGERCAALSHSLFRILWCEDGDLNDEPTLLAALAEHDLPRDLLARTHDDDVKGQLRKNTEAAVAAGVFGAPTFILGGAGQPQLFWGQDRLGLVEECLTTWQSH